MSDSHRHPRTGPNRVWFALLTACLLGGVTPAKDLDAETLLARVQGWLDATQNLEAGFTQSLVSSALGAGLEESGRVYLERPGKMRWDYLDPEFKVALVDGDRTRLYLAEDRQLWEGRLEQTEALLPTLMAGSEPLVSVFRADKASRRGLGNRGYLLRLVPLDGSEAFEEVLLTLRPPAFGLEEIEVLDAAGNRILYRFEDIRRNRGLPSGAFQFEPPPGTDVVAGPDVR